MLWPKFLSKVFIYFRRILEKYDSALQNKLEEQGFQHRSLLTDSSSGKFSKVWLKQNISIFKVSKKGFNP